jgi:cell division protein FtsB
MLPLPIGTIIKAVVALIIVILFAVGFWWITGLRADLAVSLSNTEKLTQAVEQQKAVMEQMKAEQEQIRAMTKAVTDQVAKQNNDVTALRDRFNTTASGQQRNWGKTASEKPAAVERAVNRGTVNALRCLEIASGAPLTEAEKNATKPEEINKECPAIANPNYRPANSR